LSLLRLVANVGKAVGGSTVWRPQFSISGGPDPIPSGTSSIGGLLSVRVTAASTLTHRRLVTDRSLLPRWAGPVLATHDQRDWLGRLSSRLLRWDNAIHSNMVDCPMVRIVISPRTLLRGLVVGVSHPDRTPS
jgi:hypothetical protein